jgi:hypothetical protein
MDGGNGCAEWLTKNKDQVWMEFCCIFGGTFGRNTIEESFNINH